MAVIPVSDALDMIQSKAMPQGVTLVTQGQVVTKPDGTQVTAASTHWHLGKADKFQGADGEAKDAARKQAGLDGKADAAMLEASMNADAGFIVTDMRMRRAKVKGKGYVGNRTVAIRYQEVRAMTLADMLANEKGGTPEYWQSIISKSAPVENELKA